MKKVIIHYDSHLNISFQGEEEIFEMEDEEYEDYVSSGELEALLIEEAQVWLNEHVEVWAEVVDCE